MFDASKFLSSLLAMSMLPRLPEYGDKGKAVDEKNGEGFPSATGCFFNSLPEEKLDTIGLIEFFGYPAETHHVTTNDSYVLTLHRIPHGRKHSGRVSNSPRPVVFLQHGLLGSSADWVTNLPSQSAGFVLADAGYDVWLGNVRGNVYSRKHKHLHSWDLKFWDFSWDEMSEWDLPAMVETVLKVTGSDYLHYVGHSQGTEIMFAKLAMDPNFGNRIRSFVALAPVATVGHIRGLFPWVAQHFGRYETVLKLLFGAGEFLPYSFLLRYFARVICKEPFVSPTCQNVLFQMGGPESNQFNSTRLPVYLSHVPAGTSTRNVAHWSQMMQKFDYGSAKKNTEKYGQSTPPVYDITKIRTCTHLFYSDDDWLAGPLDVQFLLDGIPKSSLKSANKLVNFNHLDFIWGERAYAEIYKKIIQIIERDQHPSSSNDTE